MIAPPPPALPPCAVEEAHQYARLLHDRHPRWIRWRETTYDQAEATIKGQPPAAPGGADVLVIKMRGKFVDDFDSQDPFDRRPHKGRYFVLVLDKATCAERMHSIR